MEWCWRSETRRDAVAIKRVSSHKQGDGVSPSVQEEEIRKYCSDRNLKIVKVVNLEESAKVSENRSEYAQALKSIDVVWFQLFFFFFLYIAFCSFCSFCSSFCFFLAAFSVSIRSFCFALSSIIFSNSLVECF